MLLSLDVVDHIFSFLQTDLAALKSCSQADPLLSRVAERYIYACTSVDIQPGRELDIGDLSSQLSKNPRIRNYIRTLAINISNDSESLVSSRTPVMKAVSSILASLPRLNKVTLALASPLTLAWKTIYKNFRLAFADILRQSSVTEVHLEGFFDFPLSILNTCQHIKTLSLCRFGTSTESNETSPSPHLESLSIRDSDMLDLYTWAIDRIGFLTSLKLRPQREKFDAFPKVFEACATSLTSLELDVHILGQSEDFPMDTDYSSIFIQNADNHEVEFPFTLSVLSHLEHLTIWAEIMAVQEEYFINKEIFYRDFVFCSALYAIARLIESSAPSLRHVVLKLSFLEFSTIDSLIEVNWDPLILLADFPTCPHIDLCISGRDCETFREFSAKEITNTLAGHMRLMQLVNLGVFSINPETKDGR